MSAPTAELWSPWSPEGAWVLYPTKRMGRDGYWKFAHRHLAIQFAARRGIRITEER
jgi:hypothetical protein